MLDFTIDRERVFLTPDLIERYGTSGPRYTSYPTVPFWPENFGAVDYRDALALVDAPARSIYVHIPFCQKRCWYCGCNVSITKSAEKAERYIDRVAREMALVATALPTTKPAVQVHWGGGTPTFLSVAQLQKLYRAITDHFPIAADAEIGIEVDPRVTSVEQISALRELGFNRLSMGVQDFNPDVQAAVGRVQPREITEALVDYARHVGFGSINLDLIYGLPRQTPQGFAATLRDVLDLQPNRVAVFNYAHLPSRFKHQRAIDESTMPVGLDKIRLFTDAITIFTNAGYRYIGFDHFARADDELTAAHDAGTLHRNFMGYSTHAGTDLIAFGASAISGLRQAYAQNRHELPEYEAAIDAGELPISRGMLLDADDELRREVITRLLCRNVVSRRQIEREWGTPDARSFDEYFADDVARLEPLKADALIADDGDAIRITPLGRLFSRNVAMCFDRYLHRPTADTHRRATFSRTV